jgi:ribonuclease P/MRP protein subunit POP8
MDLETMDIGNPAQEVQAKHSGKKSKSREIYSTTIRSPTYAYAHLELIATNNLILDDLQLRSYLTAALKQFLGATGSGMPIDILKVQGKESWVRIPRQDLGGFAAALTAWSGSGNSTGFIVRAAGDWLGALVGWHDQRNLWGEC